jgi:hypothetical protein
LSLYDHVLSRLSASQLIALRHVGAVARRAEVTDRTRIADLLAPTGFESEDFPNPARCSRACAHRAAFYQDRFGLKSMTVAHVRREG